MKTKPITTGLTALFSGALLTLAFAPFNLFPLAIISPLILLGLFYQATPKQSLWRGWVYGLGFFSTGVYWVFISIHQFGNSPIPLALLITGAMIAYLAVFPGLTGYFLNRFFPNKNASKVLFAFPAIWVMLEWVRSWAFSGFPWLLIGNSQLNSPLKGFAPILGVYGVSFFVVLSSALIFYAYTKFKKNQYKPVFFSILAFITIWIAGGLLSLINWTKTYGTPVKVSLIQGNIAQEAKWTPEQVQPTLDTYAELSDKHWDSQIIIWPESAIPLPKHYAENFLKAMDAKAKKSKTALITGIPIKAENQESYYNAVIALGNAEGMYTKTRLVPFGEYIPMRHVLGKLLDILQVPMSDFISGTELPKPIIANNLKIATFICYEIAYPEQVLIRDGDIDMILTVSNDAWFGHSIAQAQHLEIAKMRALEMGRPVLFGSNDGITAIINAKGKVQSSAPQYETYVLTDTVSPTQGKTPWQRGGMEPILGMLVMSLGIATWRRKK